MRFKIDLKIFLLIIIFFLTKQIKIYAMVMIFAILHELGHLLCGILLKMKPEKLEIKPFGISIQFRINEKDYNIKINKGNLLEVKKILVALAGPLTNTIIIYILLLINNINNYDKILMIYSNIILVIFNIIPIYPLDGGRILKGILYFYKGKYKSEKYIYIISYTTLIILTLISSIAILYFKNIAIFFAIMFLWILQIRENTIYNNRKKLYKAIKEEISKGLISEQ